MSTEDLEQYESELELQLYREYKDVVGIFTYAVETERRFYLCNAVDLKVRTEGGDVYYEVSMGDAWVWDMYRPARFVANVRVLTFRDVNIAFANELSIVADKMGLDVWEVIRLANRHPRVNILQPGPGVGGHCLPVDPSYLSWRVRRRLGGTCGGIP